MDPVGLAGGIDRTQLPADVRRASREDQARYAAALQFEQLLVQRMLTQTLAGADGESAEGSGEDDGLGAADAVSTSYGQMIPELMARSLMTGGGTGVARDLYDSMRTGAETKLGAEGGVDAPGGAA